MKVRAALLVVTLASSASAVPPASAPHTPPASSADSHAGFVVLAPHRSQAVRFPGATFQMGSTALDMETAKQLCQKHEPERGQCRRFDAQLRAEGLAHAVTLSAFSLDRYEVSVSAYHACVRAGACTLPAFTPGDKRYDQPNFPLTHVTWSDAQRYCEFAGGRLPTEAEWEFAARGKESRDFPWGNTLIPAACNHGSLAAANFELDDSDGYAGLAPIGAMRSCRSPEGVMDLAGNVAEWVLDAYMPDDTGLGYAATAVTNPVGPPTGAFHVIKGGSYTMGVTFLRAAARTTISDPHATDVGFRCAYSDAELTPSTPPPPPFPGRTLPRP